MKRKCSECGDMIMGRSDKKFCGDLCRNAYHNKYNGYRNALIRHVNHKLRRNRGILAELFNKEILEISLEELNFMGFDLRFYTQENRFKDGIFKFCYDFGYSVNTQSDSVRIIDRPYSRRGHLTMSMIAEEEAEYRPDPGKR